jgi:hypothetical protein
MLPSKGFTDAAFSQEARTSLSPEPEQHDDITVVIARDYEPTVLSAPGSVGQ